MFNNNERKKGSTLSGFVNFINAKNGINIKSSGPDESHPSTTGQLLLEISYQALPVMTMSEVSCSLRGNRLTVGEKSKQLTNNQMAELYKFLFFKYKYREFDRIRSFPNNQMDGTTHSYYINWNDIKVDGKIYNDYPLTLLDITNYCEILVN